MSAVPESESPPPLHRTQEIRLRENLSIRTIARRMGVTIPELRLMESPSADLRVSDLLRFQRALGVPISELLDASSNALSDPTKHRAELLRIMKTVQALIEDAPDERVRIQAKNLREQLLELMPELKDVSAWQAVGQRRTKDELGEAASFPTNVPRAMRNWVDSLERNSRPPQGDNV